MSEYKTQHPKSPEGQTEEPDEILVNEAQMTTLEFIRGSYPRNSEEPVVVVGYNPVSWDEERNPTAFSGILVRDHGTNTDYVIEEVGRFWTSFMPTSIGGIIHDHEGDPGAYLY